ncbi:hypothetical protein AB1N83_003902 [Pleurotus pulmonarius]
MRVLAVPTYSRALAVPSCSLIGPYVVSEELCLLATSNKPTFHEVVLQTLALDLKGNVSSGSRRFGRRVPISRFMHESCTKVEAFTVVSMRAARRGSEEDDSARSCGERLRRGRVGRVIRTDRSERAFPPSKPYVSTFRGRPRTSQSRALQNVVRRTCPASPPCRARCIDEMASAGYGHLQSHCVRPGQLKGGVPEEAPCIKQVFRLGNVLIFGFFKRSSLALPASLTRARSSATPPAGGALRCSSSPSAGEIQPRPSGMRRLHFCIPSPALSSVILSTSEANASGTPKTGSINVPALRNAPGRTLKLGPGSVNDRASCSLWKAQRSNTHVARVQRCNVVEGVTPQPSRSLEKPALGGEFVVNVTNSNMSPFSCFPWHGGRRKAVIRQTIKLSQNH